ncbi:Uncharacterised protein [Streptococcus pneumoniae]|nr:Uncharacterised protein [Streptococcus pneumoniae]
MDHDLPISIIEDELPSKSQIKFLFSLLQERIFQTKELPIEDVEEICYNAARFNEQYWRFVRYHLEQVGIIQQRRLLLEGLSDEIMNRLIAEVEIRLRNKYSELENMKSWIQVKGCRREYVLQQFGYRKEQELINCCDYCGITKEDYKKRRAQQSDFDYNWETELQKLFGLEKMEE